jgi:hypothetical protein
MRHRIAWLSLAAVLPALVGTAWLATPNAERGSQRSAASPMSPAVVTRAEQSKALTRANRPEAFGPSDSPPVAVPGAALTTAPTSAAEPAPKAAPVFAASPTNDPRLSDLVDTVAQQQDAAEIKTYYPRMHASAAEERDRRVEELAASGSGGSQWLAHFRQVEDEWLVIDNREGFGIELDEWVCFKAGCAITIGAASLELLNQFSALARDAAAMQTWHGEEQRSEPIQSDSGEIEATWIFYAPPD